MQLNKSADGSRYCLATVSSDSFIVGTLVTIYSFLKQNEWFEGDVVVLVDEISEENREHLCRLSDKLRIVEIETELKNRVDEVISKFPDFSKKRARFFSLDTFLLKGYDRVLFCDSDMLFRGEIKEVLEHAGELVVCGDGFYYQGRPREWAQLPEDIEPGSKSTKVYTETFSSGLMSIGRPLLCEEEYKGLLRLVDSRLYREHPTELTDQMVLNIHFAGRQSLVGAKFNYPLAHSAAIKAKNGLAFTDAKVIHFNGPVKPWMAERLVGASIDGPEYVKAAEFWFQSFVECLGHLHIRSRVFGKTN